MSRAVGARIDLSAIRHNLKVIRRFAPHSKIMAVIKANGYGHGMIEVAQALSEADGFGVACAEEARQLRSQGITQKILLLAGFFDVDELNVCAQLGLDVVVHQPEQVDELAAASLGKPLDVWLKIDTGMHRLGIAPDQVKNIYQRLANCGSVSRINLMTHFARADEPERLETSKQITCFDKTAEGINAECSMANSAALVKFPQAQREWVRPGIMLYGVAPFAGEAGVNYDLKPVMTFTSHIMAIRHCKRGDAIGYGGAWVCPEDMTIGVVAVGYGDGYPRHARAGTPVLIGGKRASLVGRVSMDSIFIDLSQHPDAHLGDEVVLWGQGLPVEEIAVCSNTIPYELLCKVTTRAEFVYE